MSFSSEAAKVRANIAAGAYKEKVDPFKGFFEELSYGIRERDKEKRAEEIQKRREARAEARRVREAQAAEDRKAKARERLVNGWLSANGQNDVSAENRAEIFNMVTNLGISDYGTLDALMKQNSTYTAGTAQSEIDAQMDALGQLRQGDGPLEAETQRINNLSAEGKIEFGKSRGRNVLEMGIDEVRYELSSPTLTQERREELERRLASFGGSDYVSTEMFHPDGRKATPRNADEEALLRDQGFDSIQPADPKDFQKRTLYKPDGSSREVTSQAEYDEALRLGFSATQFAEFKDRVLYKDGAETRVFNEDDYNTHIDDGWSTTKPADVEFTTRTMYADDGREQVVTNQQEMDAAIEGGFSAIKPADQKDFASRKLYKDGGEVEVFSAEEEKRYVEEEGYSREKPPKQEGFKQRTLYNAEGAQVEVFTQLEMTKYIEEGFGAVKPAQVEPFKTRTLYKGNQTVQAFSNDEYLEYLKQGFGSVKTDFVARTYYKEGQERRILSEKELRAAEADGFGPIKLDDVAQIMKDLEVDRKTAAQIQNGTLKLTTDFAGRPIVVDIASTSSEQVTPEGQEGGEQPVSADLDALLTQLNPNWKEQGLSMVVNGEQMTFSPQEIQNNESFKVNTESLQGLDGAFGLSGVLNKFKGKAGDIIGAELAPEQNQAITFMGNLRLNTLINLAAAQAGGLRDSVWNKQQIIQTLPEPAKLFEGPFEARNKTRETLRSIQTSLRLIDKAKASGTITKSDLSRSTITEASLRELERTYQTVLEAFEKSLGKAPTGQSSYIKKKSDK